jgi:predicted transglutaminase-like cysteine proteinase
VNAWSSIFATLTALFGVGIGNVASMDLTKVAFAPIEGPTSIPVGHAEFCATYRDECGANGSVRDAMELDEELWDELVSVNARVNSEIVPITDAQSYQVPEFWTYPERGYGDCEDYALAKRRELIRAGWDPSTLLLAVVRESNGAGHAVLMVRTDRGDLVLDNQVVEVRPWNETNYQFIKRQSQQNAGEWVLIDDSRSIVTTTASN